MILRDPLVAHALVRTQGCRNNHQGVHTSVNAARMSACATIITL
jgi:hypothetical protein